MKKTLLSLKQNIQPTIIAMADATHYLVGAIDQSNNFVGLHNTGQVVTMSSLHEAKQYLRDNNIESTTIEYQSAYDEMCGSSVNSGSCIQKITL
jgi:hypothetical protein